MKKRILTTLLAALVTLPALAADTDLSGVWKGTIMNSHAISLNLKVDGSSVTGTLTGGPPAGDEQQLVNGKIEGDQLSFNVKVQGPGGEDLLLSYKGKVTGNHIEGSHDSPMGTLPWEVTKK